MTVKGDALFLARGDRVVRTAGDARVSLHHVAAVALLYGKAGVREFEQDCVDAGEVVAFRAKVHGERDASLSPRAATVELRLRDGRKLSVHVEHARGSIDRPMSDAEMEAKGSGLAKRGGTGCDFSRLAALVWQLDRLPGIGKLLTTAAQADA